MSEGNIIDTNIWVYAHLEDANDPCCGLAWNFFSTRKDPVISPQVIAEYYSVMLRNNQNEDLIQRNIVRMMEQCEFQSLNYDVVRRSLAIRLRYGFSIWDSQIVAAALEAGCSKLYTEDLQSGQALEQLEIINPLIV
ncbi:MAG: PIN domain-containing protein [SAR324 cluster bacterium]|nr:PIN domain-containing protein [SAR324 cluster bacterium]